MASKRATIPAKHLFNGFKRNYLKLPAATRTMATEAPLPQTTLAQTYLDAKVDSTPTEPILKDDFTSVPPAPHHSAPPLHQLYQAPPNPFLTTTTITLHSFPTLTPLTLHPYPSTHLLLPLRKDLLHRAVIYEGDMKRQGTASTKTRWEVHGSNRKIRPQKGTGMARLGDKKSPMLRGGGVAFGPKPRSFRTELPGKVYDVAWRTALSYRYRMGELVVLGEEAEIPRDVHPASRERWMRDLLRWNRMGHPDGRTLFVTRQEREGLFRCLEQDGRDGRALAVGDVDVKDLLELGRVVVEREALEWMFGMHESDLIPTMRLKAWQAKQYEGIAASV